MKIKKQWVSWEEFEKIQGGSWTPAPHATKHHAGGADPLDFASITGFGTYLDQAVKQASAVSFTGITDTAVTATNIAAGTTGQRPGGVVGDIRYNSTLGGFEVYTGAWKSMILSGDNAILASILVNNTGLRVKDTNASHYLTIKPGSDITANRILTLTTGDAARTITLQGNPTLADWFDQAVKEASHVQHASITVGNTGLHILDTNASHDLIIKPGSDLTADRILTLTTGNAARTITLNGNPTLNDWFDQSVKQASTPTFAGVVINGGDISIKEAQKIVNADNASAYFQMPVSDVATISDKAFKFYDYITAKYIQVDIPAGYVSFATDEAYYNFDKKVKAPTLEGNLHWDYITNEPTYYPPEYHYHVGKDIVSLHLVDLDDVEADDIFDVLPTAAIHGEGNYDWWGTWDVTAGAGCSAEVVVLAGDDKYLRLTDNNALTRVMVDLDTAADHPMVIACIQFDIRQSSNAKEGRIEFQDTIGANATYIEMSDIGQIKFWDGAALTNLQAYAADTWYTIRIYWDCVSAAAAVWVDNVWKIRKDLAALEFINLIRLMTKAGDTGYTLDINNLKIFNLTV